ncbi:MAG: AMP-binding protein, partial [Terriglobales bacterium]
MMSTALILDHLDGLADEHPDKLLYSFLDVHGDSIESYTYGSFLHRTQAIAGHLLRDGRFAAGDRLLLAYPPGLEMICAFFGCVRAGLIPVPVYPPSSRGFQSALYKTVHITKDCQAAGILTSKDYHASLKTNLARSGVSASGVDVDYISNLPWIATEDFVDTIASRLPVDSPEILFLQYTSGSTMEPKGVIVTHENILTTCPLVIDHPSPVVVSWLPQYHDMGLIGCYLYPALKGGTTYGFAPMDFIQRPILWFDAITKYRATAAAAPNFAYDYCLRAGRLSKESLEACDLRSLRVLMCAAEPVKPDTYTRFLEAFQPYGLRSESFYVAFGLAENTLAVSLGGRNIVSVN